MEKKYETMTELPDLTAVSLQEEYFVPEPKDKESFMRLKESTPARLGVWHAGPRYLTQTQLRFRADHAAAQDAVFNMVDPEFIKKAGLKTLKTLCESKDEYLTRPDRGRLLDEESLKWLRENKKEGIQVQVYISDGLSSTALETNGVETMKVILAGLEAEGIKTGEPFYVEFGRVGAEDVVCEETGAEVVCVLIGERPGLVTAESLSAYIAYGAYKGMPDANRTVVSNILRMGTPAVEAGAHIVDLIKLMLEKKASGLDLNL
mgnify:FL=1